MDVLPHKFKILLEFICFLTELGVIGSQYSVHMLKFTIPIYNRLEP